MATTTITGDLEVTGTISDSSGDMGDITAVVAGDGLTGGGTSGSVTLTANVDDSTIEINTDIIRLKDGGIATAKFSPGAVDTNAVEGLTAGEFIVGTDGSPAGNTKVTMGGVMAMDGAGNTTFTPPAVMTYQEVCPVASFTDNGDATGQLDLGGTIPAGALFLYATVHAITGFAGDTTATLTIGDGTDVDRYNTGTPSVFATSAAGVAMGVPSGTTWHDAEETVRLTITGGADFTSIVSDGNGTLAVTLAYIQPV